MTNTPHGQVLEALIDLIDAYAETRHRRGGIYNARIEVARKAVIEAPSGVQALSAAPSEQQAAPKAAPGGSVNGWPVEAAIYKRRDEWVLELSGTINDCAFTCRHTQPGYLQPEDVAGLPSLYSEGTAPQPAPLSDDTKRLDWLDRNIFSREMSEWDAKYGHGPDYNMWVVFSPKGVQGSARNIIDAAIAAQGVK